MNIIKHIILIILHLNIYQEKVTMVYILFSTNGQKQVSKSVKLLSEAVVTTCLDGVETSHLLCFKNVLVSEQRPLKCILFTTNILTRITIIRYSFFKHLVTLEVFDSTFNSLVALENMNKYSNLVCNNAVFEH